MKTPDGEEITEELLCKRFPHLFKDRGATPMQSCFAFGFEIGPGWMGIVYEAAAKLEPLIVKMMDEVIKTKEFDRLDWIPTTSQLKEKFGTMRWYMTCSNEEMDKITDEAEEKSKVTCEECGAPGITRGEGWYYTRCDKCWAEHEKEYGKAD